MRNGNKQRVSELSDPRLTKAQKRIRTQLSLGSDAAQWLEESRKFHGDASLAETARRAIRLLRLVDEQQQKGNHVLLQEHEGAEILKVLVT